MRDEVQSKQVGTECEADRQRIESALEAYTTSPAELKEKIFLRKDASMTIFDVAFPSNIMEDQTMPSLESNPRNLRTMLFYVQRIVHSKFH